MNCSFYVSFGNGKMYPGNIPEEVERVSGDIYVD